MNESAAAVEDDMDVTQGNAAGSDSETVVSDTHGSGNPYVEENTGRWSKLEHGAFLKGIEIYGKEWKKVAMLVKTRTVMQTRTHAQKYYEKLAKLASSNGGERFIPTTSIKMNTPAKLAAKMNAAKETKKEASSTLKSQLASHATTSEPIQMTDFDILVPISEATALRAANKEYMDLMKVNCFIFHSLPLTEQAWFARNMVNFITVVRSRRWVSHLFDQNSAAPQYRLLADANTMVQNDFRMDPLKTAGFAFHPFWLLGEHDMGNTHNGMPFIHRTIDGSWKKVTTSQLREILKGEGLKNLLLLPPTVQLESANTAKAMAASNGADAKATLEENAVQSANPDSTEEGASSDAIANTTEQGSNLVEADIDGHAGDGGISFMCV